MKRLSIHGSTWESRMKAPFSSRLGNQGYANKKDTPKDRGDCLRGSSDGPHRYRRSHHFKVLHRKFYIFLLLLRGSEMPQPWPLKKGHWTDCVYKRIYERPLAREKKQRTKCGCNHNFFFFFFSLQTILLHVGACG